LKTFKKLSKLISEVLTRLFKNIQSLLLSFLSGLFNSNKTTKNRDLTPTIYIIAGPTAVGKTAIAIKLAKLLNTVILSADSRQCYREMNIGVARPTPEELEEVMHFFIADHAVTEALSAADYEKTALRYLEELLPKYGSVVVCGGTGLYIKALCEGLDEMPEINALVALQAETDYKLNGLEWLQGCVKKEDPDFFATGEIQNPVRLLRALIFKRSCGESITKYRTHTKKERPFRIIKVGLELPRKQLYDRINHRVDMMMSAGLLTEVESLLPYRELKNLQTVGYVELFEYLDRKCTLPEAVEKIKQHTRNYAKRQLTWFKKDQEINWFNADDENLAHQILQLA
jgi:tRNA dimethylallyltransferase